MLPKIYILFDELDAGYDPQNEEYQSRVIGLLLAVRGLSREFKDSAFPFFPVAFLRGDIFEGLHFGDKNKISDTNCSFITWSDRLGPGGCNLKDLIDHRIREQLELGSVPNPWDAAFEGGVMRGTQHKFNHITFRTYLRPRDVIKFCNCALDEAKKRIQAAGGTQCITNNDVIAARKVYSKYLINELDDEVAAGYPEWKDYLEVLRRIGKTHFSRDEFHVAYEDVSKRVALGLSEEALLEFFYRFSLVGFERAAGGAGLVLHFHYLDETIRFNPGARDFMVHRGLREGLELREAIQAGEATD